MRIWFCLFPLLLPQLAFAQADRQVRSASADPNDTHFQWALGTTTERVMVGGELPLLRGARWNVELHGGIEVEDGISFFQLFPNTLWRGVASLRVERRLMSGLFVGFEYAHESDHATEFDYDDSLRDGLASSFYVTELLGLRVRGRQLFAHGELTWGARTGAYIFSRTTPALEHGYGLGMSAWVSVQHYTSEVMTTFVSAHLELVRGVSISLADEEHVHLRFGTVFTTSIGEFSPFGGISAGNRTGVMRDQRDLRGLVGFRYAPSTGNRWY